LQRVAVCCSVLQCVAVCCSALLKIRNRLLRRSTPHQNILCSTVWCNVLQCVAESCSVLQCVVGKMSWIVETGDSALDYSWFYSLVHCSSVSSVLQRSTLSCSAL